MSFRDRPHRRLCRRPCRRGGLAAACLLVALLVGPAAALPTEVSLRDARLLGMVTLQSGIEFEGTEVGGFSAITYDPERGLFYVLADDPGGRAPARFYTLELDLSDGRLDPADVRLTGVTPLVDQRGAVFPPLLIDGEGIALTPSDTLLVSSEGNVDRSVEPSIREFTLAGRELRRFPIPKRLRPRRGQPFGVRHNLVFESLARTPDGRFFFTATENAAFQDGPMADLGVSSPVRVLKYDLASGRPVAEFCYLVEPVIDPPVTADAFRVNGLVELIALDEEELVAMERSYSQGVGNRIRLYRTTLAGATDVRRVKRLGKLRADQLVYAGKEKLVDLADLGVVPDNVEGMTFGPDLPDGRRTLILVSDNNFSPAQPTQFLALAFGETPGASEGASGPPQPRSGGGTHRGADD